MPDYAKLLQDWEGERGLDVSDVRGQIDEIRRRWLEWAEVNSWK